MCDLFKEHYETIVEAVIGIIDMEDSSVVQVLETVLELVPLIISVEELKKTPQADCKHVSNYCTQDSIGNAYHSFLVEAAVLSCSRLMFFALILVLDALWMLFLLFCHGDAECGTGDMCKGFGSIMLIHLDGEASDTAKEIVQTFRPLIKFISGVCATILMAMSVYMYQAIQSRGDEFEGGKCSSQLDSSCSTESGTVKTYHIDTAFVEYIVAWGYNALTIEAPGSASSS